MSSQELRQVLAAVQAEGFSGIGISGGEPLLYPDLVPVLDYAGTLGLIRTLTTNGMLLDEARVGVLAGLVDLIAISLDGAPTSHNLMRGHPKAFEMMYCRLEHLRRANVPFGFIFTLTLSNLDELAEVADLALSAGARLLQVHPLEEVGRAVEGRAGRAPDNLELAHAFVEVARLRRLHGERIEIQFDVADLDLLRSEPERGFAGILSPSERAELEAGALADLVSPLVVEAEGTIVPLQYGFARSFQVAHACAGDMRAQFQTWRRTGWPRFRRLCQRVHRGLTETGKFGFPFANWYGAMMEASHSPEPQAELHFAGDPADLVVA